LSLDRFLRGRRLRDGRRHTKTAASSASSTDRAVNVEKVITPPNSKGANMRSLWRKIVAGYRQGVFKRSLSRLDAD
jgi:hypothetical protein